MDDGIGGYDAQKLAQAQAAAGSQIMSEIGAQFPNSKQQPMRERVQVCHKRASGIVAMLSNLTNAVMPPTPLSGAGSTMDQIKDSTLSGDIDDLARTISQIEIQVARLSVAITGAA